MKDSNNSMYFFILCIVLVVGFVCVLVFQEPAELANQQNTISVVGSSEIEVDPNEATMIIEVETTNLTAKDAQVSNADITTQVIAALKSAGISEKSIETNYFNLYPKEEWNQDTQKSVLVGYTATNSLKVKTQDINNVGTYLDASIKAGANRIASVSFGLTRDKELEFKADALKKASELAKSKADSIASDLNVKIEKLISVSESNTDYVAYNYYPDSKMYMAAESAMAPTPISPNKVKVNAFISLMYEIENKHR